MNEHHGSDQDRLGGNPFGVPDVPEPEDDAALAFAASVALDGSPRMRMQVRGEA